MLPGRARTRPEQYRPWRWLLTVRGRTLAVAEPALVIGSEGEFVQQRRGRWAAVSSFVAMKGRQVDHCRRMPSRAGRPPNRRTAPGGAALRAEHLPQQVRRGVAQRWGTQLRLRRPDSYIRSDGAVRRDHGMDERTGTSQISD